MSRDTTRWWAHRHLPLLVFLVGVLLSSVLVWRVEQQRVEAERTVLLSLATDQAKAIESRIDRLLSSTYLAEKLSSLTLSERDVVALLHPSGAFMARSLDNASAMGSQVPADRPYLLDPGLPKGSFKTRGQVDDRNAIVRAASPHSERPFSYR